MIWLVIGAFLALGLVIYGLRVKSTGLVVAGIGMAVVFGAASILLHPASSVVTGQ